MKRIGVVALAALFFLAWSPGEASAWRRHGHSRFIVSVGWPVFYPAPYYYYPP
jgi:hypothetical protein